MQEGAATGRDIDSANSIFWNELCGTSLARALGITDDRAESLDRFDRWYFDYYPYLVDEIPFGQVAGERILEVGPGYGSVAGRLLRAGAQLTVLDIASGPVSMVAHRARLLGVNCLPLQASILDAPLAGQSFDRIVAIGAYHHTGDTSRALAETFRLLRPGGTAHVMVYNAYSHRRWSQDPAATCRRWWADKVLRSGLYSGAESERSQYDTDTSGRAAPHTDFFSASQLRRMTREWAGFHYRRRNVDFQGPLRRLGRNATMKIFGRAIGLDIYLTLGK